MGTSEHQLDKLDRLCRGRAETVYKRAGNFLPCDVYRERISLNGMTPADASLYRLNVELRSFCPPDV